MKLLSMTDFVLQLLNQDPPYNEVKMLTQISNYANFLKQPLKLEMFVPCDDEGNFLNEPNKKDYVFEHHPELVGNPKEYNEDKYRDDCLEWVMAKEKVLFDGFTVLSEEDDIIELVCKDIFINYNKEEDLFFLDSWNGDALIMNIECLVSLINNTVSNIELTQNAIKQFI